MGAHWVGEERYGHPHSCPRPVHPHLSPGGLHAGIKLPLSCTVVMCSLYNICDPLSENRQCSHLVVIRETAL